MKSNRLGYCKHTSYTNRGGRLNVWGRSWGVWEGSFPLPPPPPPPHWIEPWGPCLLGYTFSLGYIVLVDCGAAFLCGYIYIHSLISFSYFSGTCKTMCTVDMQLLVDRSTVFYIPLRHVYQHSASISLYMCVIYKTNPKGKV